MGNYNREYEKYYNKMNRKHKTSPMQGENKSNNIRKFNHGRKKNNESIGKYMASDILVSSVISGCIFFSFFAFKGVNSDFGEGLCNKFKTIISTDGYYKELALEDSIIVGAISKSFDETDTNSNKDEEENKVKLNDKQEQAREHTDESKDSSDISVESFNDFSIIEKTALDFLKDSKVIAFDGKVVSLEKSEFEEPYVYINGEIGQVNSVVEGKVKDIKEEDGVYSISIDNSEGLEILYHNLSEVNKKKGDSIKENEVLGKSASKEELKGIVIQAIVEGEYINPKEHLDFLGANSSEDK